MHVRIGYPEMDTAMPEQLYTYGRSWKDEAELHPTGAVLYKYRVVGASSTGQQEEAAAGKMDGANLARMHRKSKVQADPAG